MNRERLKKLRETFDTILDPRFDGIIGLNLVEGTSPACGTFRCVLGWYNHFNEIELEYDRDEVEYFGITDAQATSLFSPLAIFTQYDGIKFNPVYAEDYDSEAVREEVAARRDHLVTQILGDSA